MKKIKIFMTVPAELNEDVKFLQKALSENIKEYVDFKILFSFDTKPTNEELRRTNEIIEGIFWLLNDIEKTGIYADGELISIYFPEKGSKSFKTPRRG